VRAPILEDLREELLPEVQETIHETTRWGVAMTKVFRRESDNTFWAVSFRVESGDNGVNEFYEGNPDITQVEPHERIMIEFMPVK